MKQIVSKRNDIAFYLKMFPLVQIHPKAYDKSKAIVCEKSNTKGMKLLEDTYAKKEIPAPTCDTKAVDESIMLGQKLGISGTPSIVFPDGRIKSGAMKAQQLMQMIDGQN
jgi:thiol:disulfide interchange protein DsbC